jgi:hypothetical protein
MRGELGLLEAGISLCLDHQANRDENGKPLPAVTRKVYNRATLVHAAKKREVLDAWAIEMRRTSACTLARSPDIVTRCPKASATSSPP